jgi:phytoene dehydrogenase-like protein
LNHASGALKSARLIAYEALRRGLRGLAAWFGEALTTARGYLEVTCRSEDIRALWAPWAVVIRRTAP